MAAKKNTTNKELCRVLTPEFRVSYPHVFKAQASKQSDKKKYSVTMLFPKDADLGVLEEAMKQAKIAAHGPDSSKWPDLESPVTDGDAAKHADKDGYKDHWAIKASCNEDQKPGVVGPYPSTDPILNQSDFYPGCYARAYVYAYCWEYMGKEGISFILDHVQKMRDGKSFGGKKPADQVFTPIDGYETDEAVEAEEGFF